MDLGIAAVGRDVFLIPEEYKALTRWNYWHWGMVPIKWFLIPWANCTSFKAHWTGRELLTSFWALSYICPSEHPHGVLRHLQSVWSRSWRWCALLWQCHEPLDGRGAKWSPLLAGIFPFLPAHHISQGKPLDHTEPLDSSKEINPEWFYLIFCVLPTAIWALNLFLQTMNLISCYQWVSACRRIPSMTGIMKSLFLHWSWNFLYSELPSF